MSLDRMARGLIVSCQARAGHPLHDTRVIAGRAITDALSITKTFVDALKERRP